MKHVIGLVLALAMAAAVFFGAGWGVARMSALSGHGGVLTSTSGLIALSTVLGTGLLLGILMAVPGISPLASGLPGIVLLAWTALFVVSARHAVAWIPMRGFAVGQGFRGLLESGTLALAGIAMIFPLFVPSRWRGREEDDDADNALELPAAKGLLS